MPKKIMAHESIVENPAIPIEPVATPLADIAAEVVAALPRATLTHSKPAPEAGPIPLQTLHTSGGTVRKDY